ncbi:MAG: hypothetical protein WCG90_08445 [Chitinophagia bacterium]
MQQVKVAGVTFFKYFLMSLLTLIIANKGIIGFNWLGSLDAAMVAALPVIIKYLNPNDESIGLKKQ